MKGGEDGEDGEDGEGLQPDLSVLSVFSVLSVSQKIFTVTGTFPGCFCSSSSRRFMLWVSSRMSV
jgi:hypothetical protein